MDRWSTLLVGLTALCAGCAFDAAEEDTGEREVSALTEPVEVSSADADESNLEVQLQLQTQMQSENRSYTAVSNIMKTKHDTVKNSISNVR